MTEVALTAPESEEGAARRALTAPGWWGLAALIVLAAALRLSTLSLQSLWYDEAYTPVHVLHSSLSATLSAVAHNENTPPLWYLLEWAITRLLGTGAIALRALSALCGIACVPLAWAIGAELQGRRAAVICAGLVAVNPLFVWYSQEARAYELYVLMSALLMLCFLRAEREPTARRMAAFALAGSLALLSHYFAVFLLIGMVAWLGRDRARLKTLVPAAGAIGLVGVALLPLIFAQGGHGTQWIGQWALSDRLQAIPQYYLTGYSGAPLGHAIELLVGAIALAGVLWGSWRGLERREERSALIALVLASSAVLIPIVLVAFGADYLAPRNLIGAMIPLTALLAVVIGARRAGRVGMALAALLGVTFTVLTVDVNLSPRLQRGDWAGLAKALAAAPPMNVISTVELGSAPLEYYLPGLANLARGASVTVTEIDESGYAPLKSSAQDPPAPGFRLISARDINGLILYRFRSPLPRTVSEYTLREHVITDAHPEVLIPPGV